eukprot:Partr_v1_DN25737_c0_g1_i1_m74656 putative carbamoylphosphate synthase
MKRLITFPTRTRQAALLELANGHRFHGLHFGDTSKSVAGEVVFTTSLVGYPESMTDPSYRGQILVFTQPLIGNYGVPDLKMLDRWGLPRHFESTRIQPAAIVVGCLSEEFSHWSAVKSLAEWCAEEGVPALTGVDTRELTQVLRDYGSTSGRLIRDGLQPSEMPEFVDPNARNLVADVSTRTVQIFNRQANPRARIGLIDYGSKANIIRCLCDLGAEVHMIPHDMDVSNDPAYDGFFMSNGPGNPVHAKKAIEIAKKLLSQDRPLYGICMGNLIMGMAAGYPVHKLRFGNRSHNQPALDLLTGHGVMTSQNHGYALVDDNAPKGWQTLYRNIHDQSNEGIMHTSKPFKSVQFHPEARGGPEDTMSFFEDFMEKVDEIKKSQ